MRLYTRADATAIDDPEYGHFEAGTDGTFRLPGELADRLLRFHHRGEPLWETEIQRGKRMKTEDLDRRRDPAALLDAVQQILMAAQIAQAAQAAPAPVAPKAVAKQESDDDSDGEAEAEGVDPEADASAAKAPRRRAAPKSAAE